MGTPRDSTLGASGSCRETMINQRTLPAMPKSTFQTSPGLGLVEGIENLLPVCARRENVAVVFQRLLFQNPVAHLKLLLRRQLFNGFFNFRYRAHVGKITLLSKC